MLQRELSEGTLGNGVATVLRFHHCRIPERKRVNDPGRRGGEQLSDAHTTWIQSREQSRSLD